MDPQDFDPQSPAVDAPAAAPVDAAAPVEAAATSESELPAASADRDHVIEHRSFGRDDPRDPMPVTVITSRDSLASLKTTGA